MGRLAGGIATLIALLAMELISRVIAPWSLVSEFLPGLLFRELLGYSGEFAHYLLGGQGHSRLTILTIITFLIVGSWLGKWANDDTTAPSQRVMQAAAILLFITFTVFYLLDARIMEFYLQEILLTLALSFLVFAMVLHRLLAPEATQNRWRILGGIALVGLVFILFNAWTF